MKKFWIIFGTSVGFGLAIFQSAYKLINKKMLIKHCENYNDQLIELANIAYEHPDENGETDFKFSGLHYVEH